MKNRKPSNNKFELINKDKKNSIKKLTKINKKIKNWLFVKKKNLNNQNIFSLCFITFNLKNKNKIYFFVYYKLLLFSKKIFVKQKIYLSF